MIIRLSHGFFKHVRTWCSTPLQQFRTSLLNTGVLAKSYKIQMKFRPCIDLHNGIVKQIVGSSLTENDAGGEPEENFAATLPAADFAARYMNDGLLGGHVIMLGTKCEAAAVEALQMYPRGLQIGGGINTDNALQYLNNGASHVIVTSFVFRDGNIDYERLNALFLLVGRERLVIDLSCRKKLQPKQPLPETTSLSSDGQKPPSTSISDAYYVVTNKWTKYTDFAVTIESLVQLSAYCAEFLVHGVDVEGKRAGIEEELVTLLGMFSASPEGIPVTYAGGVRTLEDLELVRRLGQGAVDCTVGSALDIFGGDLSYEEVVQWHKKQQQQHL